jgi:sugar-specific transcriptional regulator TrmB
MVVESTLDYTHYTDLEIKVAIIDKRLPDTPSLIIGKMIPRIKRQHADKLETLATLFKSVSTTTKTNTYIYKITTTTTTTTTTMINNRIRHVNNPIVVEIEIIAAVDEPRQPILRALYQRLQRFVLTRHSLPSLTMSMLFVCSCLAIDIYM